MVGDKPCSLNPRGLLRKRVDLVTGSRITPCVTRTQAAFAAVRRVANLMSLDAGQRRRYVSGVVSLRSFLASVLSQPAFLAKLM
jgi:hypothetical protein